MDCVIGQTRKNAKGADRGGGGGRSAGGILGRVRRGSTVASGRVHARSTRKGALACTHSPQFGATHSGGNLQKEAHTLA